MGKKRPVVAEDENSCNEEEGRVSSKQKVEVSEDHTIREVIIPTQMKVGQKYLNIMSWNVCGLRSLATTKKSVLLNLVEKHRPDILCMQETKIQDNVIEEFNGILEGYESYWNCSTDKKGYSGTAVFLKKGTISANLSAKRSGSVPSSSAPPKKQAKLSAFFKKGPTPEMLAADNDQSQDQEEPVPVASTLSNTTEPVLEPVTAMERVSFDFEDETKCFHGEGRTITIEFTDFILVACYVPNSGEGLKRIAYRVDEWEPHMRQYLKKLNARKPVVYTGDLNVGHLDLDIHNPTAKHIVKQAGLTVLERTAFGVMLEETCFRDAFRYFYPDKKGQFTYWSVRAGNRPYNKGIRLDYFICSPDMFPSTASTSEQDEKKKEEVAPVVVHDSYILHEDTVNCSDHCPVVLVVKIK